MAKAKQTKKNEEKLTVVKDQITDAVTSVYTPKEEQNMFMMDISEFGVKFDEAEKFVKTAIRFYFENKDKKLVEESNHINEVQVHFESNDKFSIVLEKIKRFENQIKMNQYIPKKTVVDFLNDLKQ